MKLSHSVILAGATFVSSANAFAPPAAAINNNHRAVFMKTNSRLYDVATEEAAATTSSTTEEGTAEPINSTDIDTSLPEEKVMEKIGVTEDELAVGISPRDFLQYVGT